ncbi:ABC transporter substrate-binding protein [Nocardia sp. NPDC051750]|uniref:ABC transporter substrate-binding protein n=1 Tax=Nocardia sp. NPDC051750 TaxID=3364325 RepID=UPI0037A8B3AB
MSGPVPRPTLFARILAFATVLITGAALTTGCAGQMGSSSVPEGTLAISVLGAPNSFDPAHLSESEPALIWSAVYDTLLLTDNYGKLQPNAAASWEYTDGAQTLTLRLRPGMRFSSGAPVEATAVKATMDRTKATPGQVQGLLKNVAAVHAPDPLTVVLELARPDAGLLPALASSAGVIADPATVNTERTPLNPVASGPYTLDTEQTVHGSKYVLQRRDDYWNAAALPFPTVEVRVIADRTAALNALQSGELNVGSVEGAYVDRLKASGFAEFRIEANSLAYVALVDRAGEMLPPLGDLRVRRAINLAFDRSRIIETLLRDQGTATSQPFNPDGPAYDAALEKTYSFDVDEAKRLLAEAGYPNGFAVTMPEIYYSKTFVPTVTQSLAAIGIEVTWEPIPPQQTNAVLSSKRYPMYVAVEGVNVFPQELAWRYLVDSPRNPFDSRSPELTALIDRYNRELDETSSAAIARQISAFMVQQAWDAPLFAVPRHWVTKDGVVLLGDGTRIISTVRQFGLAQ